MARESLDALKASHTKDDAVSAMAQLYKAAEDKDLGKTRFKYVGDNIPLLEDADGSVRTCARRLLFKH
jgi:hypothetical protein